MDAEILAIGTELTTGQKVDTNSAWLSRRLGELGIVVRWHTTVADDLADNVTALRQAAARAGLVLLTGGLGPTLDDLTRQALAEAAGVELVLDPASLEHLQEWFARRGRPMPERNRVQALLPAGAEALPNPVGTAPGIWMRLGSAWVAALPGVPSEMQVLYEQEVRPRLLRLGLGGGQVLLLRQLHCFGAGESAIEEKLGDLTARGRMPEVGITASQGVITLRLLARAPTREAAQALLAPVEQLLRQRLGDWIYGVDEEELEDVVARLLLQQQRTVATAESITAGLVAHRLGRVPGVSATLLGGVVAYHNRIKEEMLDVPAELLRTAGAVSAAVAEAMAQGCRRRFGADLAVSTTGIAGPTGATPTKPIGLVYVGLAWEGGVTSQAYQWSGTRQEIQERAARQALNLLRLHLLAASK
jgi:nicotinamide-nucleotide amidase